MRTVWKIYRFFFYLWIAILIGMAVGAIHERLTTDMSMAFFNALFIYAGAAGSGILVGIGLLIAVIGKWGRE